MDLILEFPRRVIIAVAPNSGISWRIEESWRELSGGADLFELRLHY
jgi:hypothetical protein